MIIKMVSKEYEVIDEGEDVFRVIEKDKIIETITI